MRLRWLHMMRFGHFEDVRLDFSASEPGFHLIYGANEAGKSTALRAIHGLLYGIPERSADTHTHGSELRVAARLVHDGEEGTFIRRKGRKNTLLDEGGHPLSEVELQRFLSHIPQASFTSLYGLDHVTLRAGAEALLADGGHLGQSLFEAGVGGRGVRKLLQRLRAEEKALFLPKGQKPALNEAIDHFRKSQQQVLADSLRVDAYRELEQQLEQARQEEERLRVERRALSQERAKLERARRVLPLLSLRDDVQLRLDALADVPRLPEDAATLRERAQMALAQSEPALEQERGELARVDEQLAQIRVPESLSEVDPQVISTLRDRLGNFRKAQLAELPQARSAARSQRAEAQRVLRRLGLPEKLALAHEARLSTAEHTKVLTLLREHSGLQSSHERSADGLALVQAQLIALEAELQACPPVVESEALHRAVVRARAQLGQFESLHRWQSTLAEQEQALVALAERCAAWRAPGGAAPLGPAPRSESAQVFVHRWQELQQAGASLEQRRVHAVQGREKLRTDLDALQRQGELTSEEDLIALRQRRDDLLQELQVTPRAERWSELRVAVRHSDLAADRLRLETGRAAEVARLRAELSEQDRRDQALGAEASAHTIAHAELLQHYGEFLAEFGLRPGLTPMEALSAARELEEYARCAAEREHARARLTVLDAERAHCEEALQSALNQPVAAELSLEARLRVAERALAEQRAAAAERTAIARQLRDGRAEMLRLEHQHRVHEKALARWRDEWQDAMRILRLPTDAKVEQAQAVLADFSELFSKLDEVERIDKRIEQMTEEQEAFKRDVFRLRDAHVYRLGMGDATEHAEEVADELIHAYEGAQRDLERRRALLSEREARGQNVARLAVACEQARNTLAQLCAQARVQTPEQLQGVERQAVEAGRLERELRQATQELLGAAGGASVEQIAAEVRGVHVDLAESRLIELERELERLELSLETATREMVAKEQALSQLRGAEGAATAATEAAAHLAVCRNHAQQYVRLRLAQAVLEREIARYRERHQDPVLTRASELFARMTCRRYSGLEADFDSSDEATLICGRSDGSRTTVEGLSDGTRDPLYLALRLATLERYGIDVLPLCLDDILIHADDDRARAALIVLHEFSRHTQVLFFTHHAHLRRLARECLAAGLYEYQLPAPRVAGTTSASAMAEGRA